MSGKVGGKEKSGRKYLRLVLDEIIYEIVGGKILDTEFAAVNLLGKAASVIIIHGVRKTYLLDRRQSGDYVLLKTFLVKRRYVCHGASTSYDPVNESSADSASALFITI